MPTIPSITQCVFRWLALGLITAQYETVSGYGETRIAAYGRLLENLYDAHCEKLDSRQAEEFYGAIMAARMGQ